MNRCGMGCGPGRFAGGGGGTGWLAVMDSIALWILAVAAVLFLLGLRRRSRSWGRMARGGAGYSGGRGPMPGGPWPGWGPGGPGPAPHQLQAEATLAGRFSRGEITAEQYRAGIDTLRGQSPYPPRPPQPGPTAPVQPESPVTPVDPTV